VIDEPRRSGRDLRGVEVVLGGGRNRTMIDGVSVYPPSLPRIPPRWLGVAKISNTKVQGTQNFRQVRAAVCVIPYILCGGLYCLRCILQVMIWKGCLPSLILSEGQDYMEVLVEY
jgi:hypothetical protein